MTNNIPPVGLQAVHDTPEVAEARRKHLETWQAIAQFNSKASTAQQTQQQQHQHQHQGTSLVIVGHLIDHYSTLVMQMKER